MSFDLEKFDCKVAMHTARENARRKRRHREAVARWSGLSPDEMGDFTRREISKQMPGLCELLGVKS